MTQINYELKTHQSGIPTYFEVYFMYPNSIIIDSEGQFCKPQLSCIDVPADKILKCIEN